MTGWIKVNREIMDHWIFRDAEYFRAWILMLMMANHEGKTVLVNKKPVMVRRGSFFSSIRDLASKLEIDRRRLTRLITLLESEQMLTTNRTTDGTTFCVVNYDKYQAYGTTDGTTNRTTDRTTDGTTDRTTDGTTINKNDKNYKNDKNIYTRARTREEKHKYGLYSNVLLTDQDLEKLKMEYPDDWEQRIDELSEYMASTGRSYKNHLVTIRRWDKLEQRRQKADKQSYEDDQARHWAEFMARHPEVE